MAGGIPNRTVGFGGSRTSPKPKAKPVTEEGIIPVITHAPEGVAGVDIGTDGIIQAGGVGCSAILGGRVEEVAARVPAHAVARRKEEDRARVWLRIDGWSTHMSRTQHVTHTTRDEPNTGASVEKTYSHCSSADCGELVPRRVLSSPDTLHRGSGGGQGQEHRGQNKVDERHACWRGTRTHERRIIRKGGASR